MNEGLRSVKVSLKGMDSQDYFTGVDISKYITLSEGGHV